MAASGIAEHNEARRCEAVYLKKAYLHRQHEADRQDAINQTALDIATGKRLPSSYDAQVQRVKSLGMLQASHSGHNVDRQRRQAHYEQMKLDYSAKLPNRYSSIDYMSQW